MEGVRLVRAAMLAREGKGSDAHALLEAGQGPGCALMAAQLAVTAGDAQQVWSCTALACKPASPCHDRDAAVLHAIPSRVITGNLAEVAACTCKEWKRSAPF
jgi:hypothetical protein